MPAWDMKWLLLALEVVWVLGVALWIVLEKRSPVATLAWIFGLALLPAIGVPIYLVLGPRRLARKRRRYSAARALRGEDADLRHLPPVPADVVRQIRLAMGAAEAPLAIATELAIFQDGLTLFDDLGAAIDGARHHVHLEYYIWEPDEIGRDLCARLTRRAEAGVEVRVLVDGVGSPGALRKLFAPLVAAGGEIAFFNPPRPYLPSFRFVNFRTHRKIVVVDGQIGFTGGMNVAVCHTSGSRGGTAWRDTHLRLGGPAVAGLQRLFFDNWQYAAGRCPNGPAYFPQPRDLEPKAYVQVVASGPDRSIYPIHELVVSAIAAADERVWIVSPYLVPDEALLTALKTAGHRGVDVRLLVPAAGDSFLVGAAMRSFFDELLAAGIRVFEYLPGMHHAKTLIVDDELAIVGTANLDNRSFRLNFEVAVAIHGDVATGPLAESFERDLARSRPVTAPERANLRFSQRLAEASARLFAPLL